MILAIALILALNSPTLDGGPSQDATTESVEVILDQRDNPSVRSFLRRIDLFGEITSEIESALELARSDALMDLLDDTGRDGTPGVPARVAPVADDVDAVDLYLRFSPLFAEGIDPSGLSEREASVLAREYGDRVRAAQTRLFERARSVAIATPEQAGDAAALTLVPLMLHVPDAVWGRQTTEELPAWIGDAENLRRLERFAHRVGRPRTAFAFASGADFDQGMSRYLRDYSVEFIRARRFDEALACLDALAALDAGVGPVFDAAQLEADIGRADNAARRMRALMQSGSDSVYQRAAPRAIRYAFKAGDDQAVLDLLESLALSRMRSSDEATCVYIAWSSARRLRRADEVRQLSQRFHSSFPSHVLGAEIHFVNAMNSVTSGDYGEALRLFEYIEYRYPGSRLIPRVAELRDKLSSSGNATGGEP
ncbi:MAG: hypothetical protein AAGG07_05965 [Planctomycetota bacterium]